MNGLGDIIIPEDIQLSVFSDYESEVLEKIEIRLLLDMNMTFKYSDNVKESSDDFVYQISRDLRSLIFGVSEFRTIYIGWFYIDKDVDVSLRLKFSSDDEKWRFFSILNNVVINNLSVEKGVSV